MGLHASPNTQVFLQRAIDKVPVIPANLAQHSDGPPLENNNSKKKSTGGKGNPRTPAKAGKTAEPKTAVAPKTPAAKKRNATAKNPGPASGNNTNTGTPGNSKQNAGQNIRGEANRDLVSPDSTNAKPLKTPYFNVKAFQFACEIDQYQTKQFLNIKQQAADTHHFVENIRQKEAQRDSRVQDYTAEFMSKYQVRTDTDGAEDRVYNVRFDFIYPQWQSEMIEITKAPPNTEIFWYKMSWESLSGVRSSSGDCIIGDEAQYQRFLESVRTRKREAERHEIRVWGHSFVSTHRSRIAQLFSEQHRCTEFN